MRKKSDVSACVMTSPGEDEERIFRHRICFCGFPSYITPARVSGRHNLISILPSSTRYRWKIEAMPRRFLRRVLHGACERYSDCAVGHRWLRIPTGHRPATVTRHDPACTRANASWLRAAADTLGTLQYTRRIAATLPLGVISVVSIRFRPMPTIRADNLN